METRIKELREKMNLPQHKVAQILDLPQPRISDIERGKRRVLLEEAAKLAQYFGVKVDDLIANKL